MQKMFKKAVFLSVLILCCLHSVYGQQTEECEKIVRIVLDSVNEKSVTKIEPYLAENFSTAGRSGDKAKRILSSLLSVLKVLSYQKKESRIEDGSLILKYSVEYAELGTKEATFTFNKNNALSGMDLIDMEVKLLSEEKNRIEYNTNDIITVPITFSGNIPLVEVLLNGENRPFLLDSGSPASFLNAKYVDSSAQDGRGVKLSSMEDVNGTASVPAAQMVKVKELDFAGSKMINKEILSFDMSHLEEDLEAEAIYGLIGFDMLQKYDVFFDYAKKTLTLIKPESRESFIKKNKLKIHSQISCIMEAHIPVIEVLIGNKTYKMGIDTGAESNLLDSTHISALESFLTQKEKQELVGASGVRTEIFEAKIKAVKIGKKTYKDFLTIFSDISHLKKKRESYEGLLGYPVLSAQPVLISYTRGEIIVFR